MIDLVAEIGSNWNGSLLTAREMILVAGECGASTVKFQHYPDTRYGPCPLRRDDLRTLQGWTEFVGVEFLCSVFDQDTLKEYVRECSPERVKIASPELTDHDLLRACADYGLHIVLSTGMSTQSQILEALDAIYSGGDARVTLLHCVSSYPAPPDELNIRAMLRLGDFAPFGLSDHTLDPVVAPVMAATLGAVMVEKHFTLDRNQEGPDHSYAVDPDGFKRMVDAVRLAESMAGDGVKRVQPSEDPTARRTEEWRAA